MTMSTNIELGGSDKSMALLSQVLPSFYLLFTLSADFDCFVTFIKQRETIYLQSKDHFTKNVQLFRQISEVTAHFVTSYPKKYTADFSVLSPSSQSELQELWLGCCSGGLEKLVSK